MGAALLLLLCGLVEATASGDTAKLDFLGRFLEYGYGPGDGSGRKIDEMWRKVILAATLPLALHVPPVPPAWRQNGIMLRLACEWRGLDFCCPYQIARFAGGVTA